MKQLNIQKRILPINKFFFAILESEDNIHLTGMTVKWEFMPRYFTEEIGFLIGTKYIDVHTIPYYLKALEKHKYITIEEV